MEKYFYIWKLNVLTIKYNRWCEINNERIMEEQYAADENLDSIYWCWNCKYSDCVIH